MKFSWVQIKSKQSKLLCVLLDVVNKPARINSEKVFQYFRLAGADILCMTGPIYISNDSSRRWCVCLPLFLFFALAHSVARARTKVLIDRNTVWLLLPRLQWKKFAATAAALSFASAPPNYNSKEEKLFPFSHPLCLCASVQNCIV